MVARLTVRVSIVVWPGSGQVSLEPAEDCDLLRGWVPDLLQDVVVPARASGADDGTIAALVGTGPRQIGRVLATADADWPWWRVTNARGALPDALWERARRHYATEGTPVRDGRVDLGRARWAPPV